MAKVTNPLMSSQARGKVGGMVFNNWRGFATVKVNKSPSQPRTSRQLAIRAFCTTLTRAWSALTAGNREGWTNYANAHPLLDWTNTPRRTTGINMFVAMNIRRLDMGSAQVDTAPTIAAPASVAGLVPTGGSGQISVAHTSPGGTATQIDIWTHGPHSAGQVGNIVRAKHRSYAAAETTPTVISGLSPGLYTVFARHINEADGQASPFTSADATVT
jgi:hypothetical protein